MISDREFMSVDIPLPRTTTTTAVVDVNPNDTNFSTIILPRFTLTVNVTIVSGTFDLFDVMCKHSIIGLHWTLFKRYKNGNVGGTCKRSPISKHLTALYNHLHFVIRKSSSISFHYRSLVWPYKAGDILFNVSRTCLTGSLHCKATCLETIQ